MRTNNVAVFAAWKDHYKPIYRKFCVAGLLLGTGFASVSGFAEDSGSDLARFKLSYVEDTLGSSMISEGNFSAAQERLTAGLALHEPYERHTNLCVTLISLQNYQQAGVSCRAAVRYSKPRHQPPVPGVSERRAHKNRRALALSNLGVLYALQGQYERARESLQKSTARYLENTEVGQYNLSVLGKRQAMIDPSTVARSEKGL